jgi:integrase/recombinase XerD
MTDFNLVENSKKQPELLINAARNPRDKIFAALLARSGMRITEAISIKVTDVNFTNGPLTIVYLKERIKSKCPNCGELLGKRHFFCPYLMC